MTTLETDLAVTRDGVLVISHDPFLNPDSSAVPTAAGSPARAPPIRTLTLAELQRYDIGRINPASAYAKQFPEQQPATASAFPTLSRGLRAREASGKPAAAQHRDQDHARPSGDDTSTRTTFAQLVVDAIRTAGLDAARDDAVVRLAHARRRRRGSRRRSRPLPDHRDRRHQRYRPARDAAALAVDRGARPARLRRLGAAARQGRRLRDLVAVLAQRDARRSSGSARARAQGAAVDGQRSRRHGAPHRHAASTA